MRLLIWLSLPLLIVGCASFRTGQAPNAAVGTAGRDTTIGSHKTTDVAPGRDLNVGGGSDSIALWLAISLLGLGTILAYPVHRKIRLWKENGKHQNDRGYSMSYSEWGYPSQPTTLGTSGLPTFGTGSARS